MLEKKNHNLYFKKIPLHLVSLLGKIHALSIEVLSNLNISETVQDNLMRFSAFTSLQQCQLKYNRELSTSV